MSIACPYCKAVLTPKGLKPGRYTPKCPKCGQAFLLVVPETEGGTISVQQLVKKAGADPAGGNPASPAKKAVAPATPPATQKIPPQAKKAAAPATPPATQKIPPQAKKPKSAEDAAAAVLNDRDPGNVTGDFTEAEVPPPAAAAPKKPAFDPMATGDFTEAEVPPPAAAAPKKPAFDPMATGDFTEAGDGGGRVGEATGDFTEAGDDSADPVARGEVTDPMATGDFTEHDAAEDKPKAAVLKPDRKARARAEAESQTESDDDVPPRLGGYEVLKVLGKGGMGAVLLGRQISLDRKVALKVMHPRIAQNPNFVARFTREAYAAAQLTHHNVIQIYDIGEDRGKHFFSMEFVQGQSLMDLVKKEGRLAPEVAVGYILQAARGLRYGHNQGMVHRDIKPDNLMINTEGVVKVADLGLVKLPAGDLPEQAGAIPSGEDDGEGSTELTRAGAVMGTPAYMAPEQSRDSASVDARADIYSLGCTLYVLVTGKTPFEGKTAMEIISKHQTEPIKPPDLIVKRIPKALSAIILKMTAKKPEDRYQNMDELIADLEGFLGLEKSGTFNPKEEQADQLEKCCHQFNYRSRSGLKRSLVLGFYGVCLLGVVVSAFGGMPALAGGFLGLMLLTPLAYFVIHGTLTGGVIFPKVRALVFGMRFFDWVMWLAGGLLFLATLYLFGLLWSWIGFSVLAVGLGFLLWFLTDRAAARDQEAPLEEARGLLKSMRLSGLDEEQVRQFVCKFSGTNWEPFYEALFGYEAKIAARAYRKGETGESWKKADTWREPILAWLDARLEARRLAREQKHLQKVEEKALEAEGVSRAEARAQAEALAAELVGQVAEVKKASKEGKPVSVLTVMRAARERKKPQPGYNLAGKPLRSLWLKDFLNEWLGRRLRLVLGVLTFAIGLFWMHQNQLFERGTNIFKNVMELEFEAAKASLDKATGRPLQLPSFLPVPEVVLKPFSTINVALLGFLTIMAGIFFYGWRPNLAVIAGLVVGIGGPLLGIPDIGPVSANLVSLALGAVLILPVAWVLRH